MQPPASASLYLQLDHDRAVATPVASGDDGDIVLELDDGREPVRWGASLMAVRRTGRWSRHRDTGRCTVDLVPAGAGRTLAVLTLEQPRRSLARPVEAGHAWSALNRLRDVLEAGGVAPREPAAAPAPVLETRPSTAPTPAVPSGILPS